MKSILKMKYLLFLLIISISQVFSYTYDVSVLAIFQNESDYLEEWIEYHKGIGIQKFILYNHFSDDNYESVLSKYIQENIVDLRNWDDPRFPKSQLDAYVEGIKSLKKQTKWLAIIDIDEFIIIPEGSPISIFLEKYEKSAGLVVNWQLFGTNNIYSLPKGARITEHLTKKASWNYSSDWSSNYFVKSIIRPDRIDENSKNPQCGNHVFMPLKGYFLVNSNNEKVPVKTVSDDVLVNQICLNHYWFRTIEWFYNNKLRRRSLVGESYDEKKIKQIIDDCNFIEDTAIFNLWSLAL